MAGDVVKELKGHKDRSATVLFVTIWELGEATGPLFLAPLSEMYGRFVVYNVANCLFIVGIIITALSRDINLLIFSRFLTGCAVATNVLNPAIIGDMFPSETRGAAMSCVALAPLIGGALGYDCYSFLAFSLCTDDFHSQTYYFWFSSRSNRLARDNVVMRSHRRPLRDSVLDMLSRNLPSDHSQASCSSET